LTFFAAFSSRETFPETEKFNHPSGRQKKEKNSVERRRDQRETVHGKQHGYETEPVMRHSHTALVRQAAWQFFRGPEQSMCHGIGMRVVSIFQ
jgi:hypothetical protein